MAHWKTLGTACAALGSVFALSNGASAQFVLDNGKIPNDASRSENVDFADVDLDGDWDAAIADGGDGGNDQNRLWTNDGGMQGGTLGFFSDVTATQFPTLSDDSRDIEFVDFDNDGDQDIYISNTSQLSTQGNRWWTNDGGLQGGSAGFYSDETAIRWVDLGTNGSSVAPSLVVDGTFIDFSCDCDFGDLDNDGDLDLVHSSYGGAFGGLVPTRLYLNDGNGFFKEFNPSGFQLTGQNINNGNPGLWCEGTQQNNTTNNNGTFCDINTSTLDIDVGDTDGDFDLDILHGNREEPPRFFRNRLEEKGGTPADLGFRDVTTAVFPPNWGPGNGHYEQEMGDLDGDGDLDIYGLNWNVGGFSFTDITMSNNGAGVFGNYTNLPGSGADDNEGDFFDYDNDGDLDLYVANFSGQDKLYRNNNNGGTTFSFTQVSLPGFPATSLDADCCDTDGDGDYDVLISEDGNQPNTFLRNVTQVPDIHAPYLPALESITNQTASATDIPVRVQVYDNAPYYITWYNDTDLHVSVDGIDLPAIDAMSSAGQIFRGLLPGNLVGSVTYSFTSADEYSNIGSSGQDGYVGSYGPSFQATYGSGTAGSAGGTPTIQALSAPLGGTNLYLAGSSTSGAAGKVAVAYITNAQDLGPTVIPGIATLNIAGDVLFTESGVTDANGDFVAVAAIPVSPVLTGVHVFAQYFVNDVTGGGALFASSAGLDITLQ